MRPPVRKARPSFGIRYSASATVGRSPGVRGPMDPRIRQQVRSDANRKRGCPTRSGQPLFRFLPPPFGTSAEPASPFPQRLPGILFRFIGASRNNGTSSFSVEDAGCKITGPKGDNAPSCDRAGTPFLFRPRTVRPGGKRRLHRNPAIRTVSTGGCKAGHRFDLSQPGTGSKTVTTNRHRTKNAGERSG